MSAGTLTLTNKSTAVSGAGTAFTTDLKASDFVVVVVGGTVYSLAVESVTNNGALVLSLPFEGPTTTGVAWSAVPRKTMLQVTAELNNQVTAALRIGNLNIVNLQAVLVGPGDVQITLPDGSQFTGPSWKKIADILATIDLTAAQAIADQIHADAQQVAADKTAAAGSASTASTGAATATTKAGEASASATTATEKATAASDSADLAQKWAINPEDTAVTTGNYSALHWAAKAEKSAAEAASHNPNEALVKSLNLSDLADRAAAWLNVRPEGPTTIAADAVNDYDAPTFRQVRNMVGAGTAGPTMNGVMNYGVGQTTLWLSRAYIPPYALPEDGQLVNRADWPELWAHAQQHGAIEDSLWIADPNKRAMYSTGDGSTTFRMRDLNGIQKNGVNGFTGADSILSLFGRGDQGSAAGTIIKNGAPNITGNFDLRNARDASNVDYSPMLGYGGAISGTSPAGGNAAAISLTSTGTTRFQRVTFDASKSSDVYGSAGEIRPNCFFGVWITRASGGFVAANTSWSVINADSTLPGSGTEVYGGGIRSEYKVAGVVRNRLEIKVKERVGGDVTPVIALTAKGGSVVNKTIATLEDFAEATKWRYADDPLVTEYFGFNSNDNALRDDRMFRFAHDMSSVEVRGLFNMQTGVANRNLIDVLKLPTGFTSWSTVYSPCQPSTGEGNAYIPKLANMPARGLLRTSAINTTATWVQVNLIIVFNK